VATQEVTLADAIDALNTRVASASGGGYFAHAATVGVGLDIDAEEIAARSEAVAPDLVMAISVRGGTPFDLAQLAWRQGLFCGLLWAQLRAEREAR